MSPSPDRPASLPVATPTPTPTSPSPSGDLGSGPLGSGHLASAPARHPAIQPSSDPASSSTPSGPLASGDLASQAVPGLVVFDHPLIRHKLSYIRDRQTGHRPFRALVSQVAQLMVYEVTRGFETRPVHIDTPMGPTTGARILAKITVVPILRAGLGMAEGVLEIMPEARVGHLGLARDEVTLQPKAYLKRLPADLDAGPVVVVDPMLATGGSASAAIQMLKDAGARDLRVMCLVAAPEGVARLQHDHPGVTIYTAALDERLNDRGFILPGLGDAGDRLYGT